MRRLIISEKNHAALRIALILSNNTQKRRSISGTQVFSFPKEGHEYHVMGLRGHIIELDYPKEYNNWDSVSPKELVYAKPEKRVDDTARHIMKALKELACNADEIIVATDYDREGELIGVEALAEVGRLPALKRAKFSALTKGEIERAFSELGEIDYKLAQAAETRQLIDLAWGASLTRFISLASGQLGKDFLSVGRVQTPTLALIVAREKAIKEFVPVPYWNVSADLRKEQQFQASHKHGRFDVREEAHEAVAKAKKAPTAKVTAAKEEEKDEWAPSPFSTTLFLAEASKLGISASMAMKVAEDLYTNGYISYPRTDNTVYPPSLSLRHILEKLKGSPFGAEAEEILAQESIRPSRGKKSTTDHPPIHPVEAATKAELKGQRWDIYELVTRRFLATVAPPCRSKSTVVDLDIGGEPFVAEGYNILFPGWRKYYPYYRAQEVTLPKLEAGEEVGVEGVHSAEKKTQPPNRYSQGTLIQEMERLGLGTKSTRHEAIQKLYDRRFAEGARIEPTESGIAVISALEDHAKLHHEYKITDAKMTAHLEGEMDLIAQGEREQADVVQESQDMLDDILDVLERNKKEIGEDIKRALRKQHALGPCPKCGNGEIMQIRQKGGGSFAGCSNYPECRNTYPLPSGMLILPTEEKCETCGAPKVKAITRGQAPTTSCIDPKCPSVQKERYVGKCPNCGSDLQTLMSRNGKRFAGCSKYPECRTTYALPQYGKILATDTKCEACGAPVIKVFNQKGRPPWVLCINLSCPKRLEKKEKAEKKAKKKAAPKEAKAAEPKKE